MILADQCVYELTIRHLESLNFRVARLRDLARPDSPDRAVLDLAVRRDEILLTNDTDFGDILRYPPSAHQGIILLRIRPETEDQVHSLLFRALNEIGREGLRRRLLVIDRNKYRLRSGL